MAKISNVEPVFEVYRDFLRDRQAKLRKEKEKKTERREATLQRRESRRQARKQAAHEADKANRKAKREASQADAGSVNTPEVTKPAEAAWLLRNIGSRTIAGTPAAILTKEPHPCSANLRRRLAAG